MIKSSYQF